MVFMDFDSKTGRSPAKSLRKPFNGPRIINGGYGESTLK